MQISSCPRTYGYVPNSVVVHISSTGGEVTVQLVQEVENWQVH